MIIHTVLSGAAATFQKDLVARGRVVPTSSFSFVGVDQFIAAAGPASAGVSIGQVVPNPGSFQPAVRDCAKALEAAGSKTPMNSTQLEACLAARVLAEGIRRVQGPVNPQSLLQSLTNLGSLDLGGYRVSFAPGALHGSKFVELGMGHARRPLGQQMKPGRAAWADRAVAADATITGCPFIAPGAPRHALHHALCRPPQQRRDLRHPRAVQAAG